MENSGNIEYRDAFEGRRSTDVRLHYDVLHNVMLYLVREREPHLWYEQRNLLALMTTCRTLYYGGMAVYLGGKVHVSKSPKFAEAFCSLMLGSGDNRARYIKDLSLQPIRYPIHDSAPGPARLKLTGQLALILQNTCNLRRLEVLDAQELLDSDEQFWPAILSLKKLDSLVLHGASGTMIRLLHEIKSPLTHLALDPTEPPESSSLPIDLILALGGLNSRLKKLQVPWGRLRTTSFQYPNVTKLYLGHRFIEGDPQVLYSCFPNVQNLRIYFYDDEVDVHGFSDSEEESEEVDTVPPWSHLDELGCDLDVIHAKRFKPKVRMWRTMDFRSENKKHFHSACKNIAPSHLQMGISTRCTRESDLEDIFSLGSSIAYLDMVVRDFARKYESFSPKLLELILLSISPLPLRFLNVTLADLLYQVHDWPPNSACSPHEEPSATNGKANSPSQADMLAHVRRLVEKFPELEYAFFFFHFSGVCKVSLWEISRVGFEASLRSLSELEGQNISRAHGFVSNL